MKIFKNKLLKKSSAILMSMLMFGNSASFAMKGGMEKPKCKKSVVKEEMSIRKYFISCIDLCIKNLEQPSSLSYDDIITKYIVMTLNVYVKIISLLSNLHNLHKLKSPLNLSNTINKVHLVLKDCANKNIENKNCLIEHLKELLEYIGQQNPSDDFKYMDEHIIGGYDYFIGNYKSNLDNLQKSILSDLSLSKPLTESSKPWCSFDREVIKKIFDEKPEKNDIFNKNISNMNLFIKDIKKFYDHYYKNGENIKFNPQKEYCLEIILRTFCMIVSIYKEKNLIREEDANLAYQFIKYIYIYYATQNSKKSQQLDELCNDAMINILDVLISDFLIFDKQLKSMDVRYVVLKRHFSFDKDCYDKVGKLAVPYIFINKFINDIKHNVYNSIKKFAFEDNDTYKINSLIADLLIENCNKNTCYDMVLTKEYEKIIELFIIKSFFSGDDDLSLKNYSSSSTIINSTINSTINSIKKRLNEYLPSNINFEKITEDDFKKIIYFNNYDKIIDNVNSLCSDFENLIDYIERFEATKEYKEKVNFARKRKEIFKKSCQEKVEISKSKTFKISFYNDKVKKLCEKLIGKKLKDDGSVGDEDVKVRDNNSSNYLTVYKNFYKSATTDGLTYDSDKGFSIDSQYFTDNADMDVMKKIFASSIYYSNNKAICKGKNTGFRIIYKPIEENGNIINIQILYAGTPFHGNNTIDTSLYKSSSSESSSSETSSEDNKK